MAVLFALVATTLLTAIAAAIALLGIEESMLAGSQRTAMSLRHASMGALHLAIADLRRTADWSVALNAGGVTQLSVLPSRFADSSLTPALPWGGSLDLAAMTARLQSAADAAAAAGDPQTWRLFAYGPLERNAPGIVRAPWYLAVWIADDRADSDGDPLRDANGIVSLRSVAIGPFEAIAVVEASLSHTRILTIRPGT
jgi:hypothetical protein